MLAREHDRTVLRRLFELAAQQHDRIPPAALRGFVTSDRDETPRALAVELLADQDRMTPPPAPCSDRSPPTTRAVRCVGDGANSPREPGQPGGPASEVPSKRRMRTCSRGHCTPGTATLCECEIVN